MKYILLFEKFTDESTTLSKKELKRLKYSKILNSKIVSIDDLNDYDIPEEIQQMMKSWEVINKSPYSDTFYNSTDIDWSHKPDKSYRVSDHWNFYTRDKWHCQTLEKVPNVTHISIGQYDAKSGLYKILLTLPTSKQKERLSQSEIKRKYLKDPEVILRKKEFKDRVLNKEVLTKLNYNGKDYEGVVRKYTGSELKIEDDKGNQIFNKNSIEPSNILSLEFFDKEGNKIENPMIMKHLMGFDEAMEFHKDGREKQLDTPDDARVVLSKIYDIVDEIKLGPRDHDFVDFIVEFDDFIKYAEEHDGSFAGNRFDSLDEFKSFMENEVESVISPLIYIAPFWFTRTESDLLTFRDVYSDTIYVKLINGDLGKKEIKSLQDSLECDEMNIIKSSTGESYLRIWWD